MERPLSSLSHSKLAFLSPGFASFAAPRQDGSCQHATRSLFWCRRPRARPRCIVSMSSSTEDDNSSRHDPESNPVMQPTADDNDDSLLYDELVSDDEYVVIDGKDIDALVRELQEKGLDDLGSSSEEALDAVMQAAEAVDTAKGNESSAPEIEVPDSVSAPAGDNSSGAAVVDPVEPRLGASRPLGDAPAEPAMEYFTEENVSFMPSWARSAFLNGTHREIEDGARRIGKGFGSQRLEAMIQAEKSKSDQASGASAAGFTVHRGSDIVLDDVTGDADIGSSKRSVDLKADARKRAINDPDDVWNGAGIHDCCVSDVADDYSVPVELIIDIMATYGVRAPISPADNIRDRLTIDEIQLMLELITSFDSMDLSERYSDHTITELADHYDLDVSHLISICDSEDIDLPLAADTRLQLTREDRVLDIARGKAVVGSFEYPSLLHGLVVKNDD